MKGNITLNDDYAVSEVVGGMILVLIAVISFAAIYFYLIPNFEHVDENIRLQGYVTDNGIPIIEHKGGPSISSWRVVASRADGTSIGSKEYRSTNPTWNISECKYPLADFGYAPLLDENDKVYITIYNLYDDGSEQIIFDGSLQGKTKEPTPTQPASLPMLVSSLMTNTVDEDLICYNYTITPNISASTHIYNWIVNGAPITNLLMPFDTNSLGTVKDYSGNQNNGTASGPVWTNDGVVGGAYQFDGVDDHISLPYCFENNFIDAITVETWIKTASQSGVISSYNRNKYWELGATNGKIQWSTTASDGTRDTTSISNIDDGNWHHVVTTYDSFSGESSIYIDGEQNIKNNEHGSGELLGTGETPQGSIGTGPEAARTTIFSTSFETQDEKNQWKEDNETWTGGGGSIKWEPVFYDSFETSWGNWNDGGLDCSRYTGTYAHQGSYAIDIQDNSGYPASATYSDIILADSLDYTQMSIDFWWKAVSMENGEDFWVNYYDGTTSYRLATIVIGTGQYSNNVFYHTVCYVNETSYPLTDQATFRIQCDASDDFDDVYLDQIYINATTGFRVDYDFNIRDSSALNPRTGSYSISGTGDFDPEYAYFNRTGIDLSGYKDVTLSVWYSYKSTESSDKIGLYYKNGANWVTIFEQLNPQIGNGNQLIPWTNVQIQIPNSVDDLVLQFRWSTSAIDEYMAIDDLEITGIPLGGEFNFSGLIDEFHIYNRALSAEQVYQNYLSTKDGYSDKSVIISEEISLGDIWRCIVTPNDTNIDDEAVESNTLQIVGYSGGE